MTYRVILSPRASQQIENAFRWGALRWTAERNEAWFRGLREAIESLSEFPERCGRALESEAFSFEVRQLLYPPYRVLFRVVDDTVRILAVRRFSQDLSRTEEP